DDKLGRLVANVHEGMGWAFFAIGRYDDAAVEFDQCRMTRSELAAAHPDRPGPALSVSHALEALGDVRWEQLDLHGALAFYRQALAIRQNLFDASPASLTLRRHVCDTHRWIGDLLTDARRGKDAVPVLRLAVAMRREGCASLPDSKA